MIVQTSGPAVDVLGAHRTRRNAARMPTPYILQQHSRASSIASHSVAGTEESQSQQSFATRTGQNGVTRQIRSVSRRTQASIRSGSGSQPKPPPLQSSDKKNHKFAIEIYLSDLSLKKAWPDSVTSTQMADEAIIQANHIAKEEGRATTLHSDTFRAKVYFLIPLYKYLLMTHI